MFCSSSSLKKWCPLKGFAVSKDVLGSEGGGGEGGKGGRREDGEEGALKFKGLA